MPRLRELDALRGIAAVAVLFWHYSGHFHAQPLASVFAAFYRSGYYAVDFFFVLSGLVLARAYGTRARRTMLAENIVRRIARMFPLHVATLIMVACGQYLLTEIMGRSRFMVGNNDLYHFLLNLGLAQYLGFQDGFSFNAPSWSISTEFYVNLLFLVLLASCRRIAGIAIVLVAVSAAIVVMTGNGSLGDANTIRYPAVTLIRTICGFFTGVVLYEVLFCRLRARLSSSILFDLGFVLTVATLLAGALGHLRVHPHVEMASVLLGFPALILCTSHGYVFKRVLRLAPFSYLGDISYSIYLIHFPVQLAFHLLRAAGWIRPDYQSPLMLVTFLAVTVGLASASYHLLELPCQQGINDWWRRRGGRGDPVSP
ncbi:MAG: acyltransferase [bacterium]|nr:acyltransferase [bacterium]